MTERTAPVSHVFNVRWLRWQEGTGEREEKKIEKKENIYSQITTLAVAVATVVVVVAGCIVFFSSRVIIISFAELSDGKVLEVDGMHRCNHNNMTE